MNSLLIGCPVLLPPRDDVVASWTYRPHLVVVNGANDEWGVRSIAHSFGAYWPNGGGNMGVAASWNAIFRHARDAGYSHVALVSQGVVLDGGTQRLAALVDEYGDERGLLTDFAWRCIVLSVDVWEQVGPFDERFAPAYYEDCLTPDTPVLTAALDWRAVGDLPVGAEIVGVDERGSTGTGRAFRRSRVTRNERQVLECYRITMEDGRQVRASRGHGWLTASPNSMNVRWRPTGALQPGQRIYAPLRTWTRADTFEAGWLAGILDGEGTIHHGRNLAAVDVAQTEGVVFDTIKQVLTSMDIPFTWRIRNQPNRNPIGVIEVSRRPAAMELLGRLHPHRLKSDLVWEGRASTKSRLGSGLLRVESIEPIGPTETVALETTTRTLVANGMISHNSDYTRRLFLAGIHAPGNHMRKVDRDVLDGTATEAASMRAYAIDPNDYGRNRVRYERKWGGEPFHETWDVADDPRSLNPTNNWAHSDVAHNPKGSHA